MKLLFCKKCYDIIKLQYYKRYCDCGSCSGKYINEIQVQVEGHNAVILGIDNADIRKLAQDKVGKFEIFKSIDKERIINLSENKVDFRNTKLGDYYEKPN